MAQTMLALPEELVTDIFNKVQGHSSVAKMCAQKPIPFNGEKEFIFNLEGEAAIVGEGEAKPASSSTFTPVIIRPIKLVYQTRVTDEFVKASDEARLPWLQAFADGFARKIGRGIDIAAFHGLNPRTMTAATSLAGKNFDDVVDSSNVVTYNASTPDDNLDTAVQAIVANGMAVNGIIISPAFGAAMATVKVNGVVQYPEFRFGGVPGGFAGYKLDANVTVPMTAQGGAVDHAIVGDFQNAFKWGYAKNIPMEIIEYGDPDGAGRDLKQYNEVCLRAEAYVGWGILDADSFALIQAPA